MGQSASTPARRSSAAGRGPSTGQAQQQQRQAVAGRYPGAPTGQQFNMQNQGAPNIPNIGQMQNIFLEGMRPELAHLNNPQRQQPASLQRTFTIRNDVNLKKNSLKMFADEANPQRYHLEFVFDAATECSIAVHWAVLELSGKERPQFAPLKEGASHPKVYRPKGLGQTFRTQSDRVVKERLGRARLETRAPPRGAPGGSGRLDTPTGRGRATGRPRQLPRVLERASLQSRPISPPLQARARA